MEDIIEEKLDTRAFPFQATRPSAASSLLSNAGNRQILLKKITKKINKKNQAKLKIKVPGLLGLNQTQPKKNKVHD